MPLVKGGELIVEHLIREGMPYVFGICGHGNVGLLDAMYDRRDAIKLISPRHEQIAGHMADAYYRVSHQPVATLTSCGPGSANLIMATACAHADSSAFLAITANVPTAQFNRGPFQETYRNQQAEYPAVIRPYVKRCFQPTRVEMLPLALRLATRLLTTGRPGPVNLDVPFNLFQEQDEIDDVPAQREARLHGPGASPDDVKTAVELLLASKRPALFVGHGVTLAQAGEELTELVELLGVPVISSPNGMGTLDMTHPLSLGFIGRNGAYPANQAGRHCDVLLAIGARFDDRSSSSWIPGYSWNMPATRLIQVDIDSNEIGRNYAVELGVVADAKVFLRQLIEALRPHKSNGRYAEWRGRIEGWQKEWDAYVRPHFATSGSPLRPERFVRDVQAVLPADAILSLDSGVHHNWFMQFWRARRPQTMLNSWGFSAMGFGVAGVLGAKLAAPDRPCIAVVGDGGFTMCPAVLCTAVEYDIPAIWVIWNNFAWAAIRDIQHGLFDGREIGTAFFAGQQNAKPYNPDFAAMARSYGVNGVTVTHSDQFADALRQAIASGKPCVLDVHVDANIRPPSTGAWALPPLRHKEPVFGKPYTGDE
jgi:acetolactate synthase I/II/III large subunit